ncbi:hypothetical protein [Caryophanon latum]|uniref:Uncharacterized protein n=1 Tax=Caryophanon latum TaxID=33977 RepID=A0A1C0YZI2_9BACL|nr:hypothetical protein [Caryophanon latum]OCS92572.1 hypothetical protein A6K76_06735 [Caryophanon latum]
MSQQYITQRQIDEKSIKITDLHSLGRYDKIIHYRNQLTKYISEISHTLSIESSQNGLLFELYRQENPIKIENKLFAVYLICNPIPTLKREKPNGLVIEQDLSFIQMQEVLLYDVRTKELYCFEYSYHYSVWDYNENKEIYYFRYDKDILLSNPPKKSIHHLHVVTKKPHFESPIVNLQKFLEVIVHNWNMKEQRLDY